MSSLAAARQQFPHLNDYTDQELLNIVAQSNNIAPGSTRYKTLERDMLGYDRSVGDVAKDTGLALGQGVMQLGKLAGMAAGAVVPGASAYDNPVTNFFDAQTKRLDPYKSAGLQAQEAGAQLSADIAEREAAARGDGAVGRFVAGAGAQLGNYVRNPGLAVNDVVANVPQLLAGGMVGRGLQTGAAALRLGQQAATRVGAAGAIGTNAGLQAGDVAGDTYERARAAGATHEQAAAAANEAAVKAGAVSVGLNMLPGASTIERSMLRGNAVPARFGLGRAGTVAMHTGAEAGTEAVEEGYGQYAGNQGVQTFNPNIDLMSGVGRAATQGAVASAPVATWASMRTPVAAPAPRTATGEIDLAGTAAAGPSPLDVPTYQRRGLDPLATYNAKPNMADIAGPVVNPLQMPQAQYTDLVAPPAAATPDPYTAWENDARARSAAAAAAEQDMASRYVNDLPGAVPQAYQRPAAAYTDLVAPAAPVEADPYTSWSQQAAQQGREQARDTRHAAAANGTAAQGPGVMMVDQNGTVLPAQSPQQMAETERARQAQVGRPQLEAPTVTRGKLLQALQAASSELGRTTTKKDGELANTKANASLRAVLEAKDPLEAIRELHKDGSNPRDELLDVWHQKLTGQTVFEWRADQAKNSAGFVAEPVEQVAAQVAAVREGRKPVAVMGKEEAAKVDLKGLTQGVAVGPDGTSAVVVAQDPARVQQAVARAKEVGLKLAMGEALEVANPTITSQTSAPAAVAAVQQVDNKTGQVIAEELVTPADLPNVKPVPGTTPRIVPADQPVQDRTKKAPKYGRHSSADLIQVAENTKDEGEYTEARYELYKRWANDTDDGVAYAYLNDKKNKSNITPEEVKSFEQRHKAELEEKETKKGQELGAKFAAKYRTGDGAQNKVSTARAQEIVTAMTRGWKNVPAIEVVDSVDALPDEVRAQMDADGVTSMKAGYVGDKVWIVADSHASESDVSASVLHEIAGHHGLRAVLGQQFDPMMRQVFAGNPDIRKAAEAMMQSEKLPLETAVEEALADAAEQGDIAISVLERIGNWIRQTLRKVGLAALAPGFTNAEVKELLIAARQAVESGPPTGPTTDTRLTYRLGDALAPLADAAKKTAAAVKAQASGAEINPTMLKLLTLRQIDEQFGKKLPALREWIGAIMERSAKASKLAAEADRVALQWEKSVSSRADRQALADVLLRASVAELYLDNTKPEYLATLDADQLKEHAELRAKLARLSPEAQRARTQALEILRRQWEYTRDALESFINHTVADPALRNARLDDLKRELGRNRGDYFPLSRFGNRVVIAHGAAADGRDIVSFHESAYAAETEKKRLEQAGAKKVTVTLQTERDPKNRASTGFLGDLHAMIDKSEADGAIKDSMHDALQQLYLKSMPELSGAKHMIRREGVEGYSEDALRVFADAVSRGSRYASHLEYGPVVQAAMEAAEAQSRSSDKRTAAVVIGRKDGEAPRVVVTAPGTDRLNAVNQMREAGYDTEFFNTVPESAKERLVGALEGADEATVDDYVRQVEQAAGRATEGVEDMRAAKALYNHMVGVQKTEANQETNKIVEGLGQAGYVWFLGFSPAFWATNMLQNPMVGVPHLGAKYGLGRTAAEWLGAAKWFTGVRIGKALADAKTPFSVEWLKDQVASGELKGISKQELDMLQTLEDRQVLDFTQAMDLSRIGQASGSTKYKFLRLAAAGAHHTEVFNRVTFALAAYRLALKSSAAVNHAEAVRRAENDLASVHFDYSYANKPEIMRGRTTRLLFMFQQYRQHMLYWWAKQIKDMVKNESPGDRKRAFWAAGLMGVSQAVFAGAMGLPFVGTIALLANLFGGEDDDGVPFDFERWINEAAKEYMGESAGVAFSKGLFGAMGLDISKRIGQGDLFITEGSERYERNADDKARARLFDLAGPLGSIALGAARSTEAFERGDTLAGLAAIAPKAVADVIKAYQLDVEGMKDKKGQFLATAEAFDGADKFLQAAGVTPVAVSAIRSDKGKVSAADQAIRDRSRQITGKFVEAWMRGDRDGVMEVLSDVKAFNTRIAERGLATREFLIDGRQLESAIKDRQQRAMLLALTGGTAETRRQLLLSTRMSGLFEPVTAESMREHAGNLPGLPGLPGLPAR